MDPSSGQHQEIPPHSMENMLVCSKAQDKKPRPQPDQALKCPRCDSTNTKFCYYNNYSLSQPRYFCKSCRRYWTKGGTLRNVPVGGGCRKNKRSSTSKRAQDQALTPNTNINPLATLPQLNYDSNDLALAFARLQKQCGGQLGFDDHDLGMFGNPINMSHNCDILGNSSITTPAFLDGFLEAQNNFQQLFYGYNGNGHMGDVENGGVCVSSGEMVMPYENTSNGATIVKQEVCLNGRESDHENKVLWGFPNWQQINGNGSIMGGGDFNGLGSTNWHGLLNSPLM